MYTINHKIISEFIPRNSFYRISIVSLLKQNFSQDILLRLSLACLDDVNDILINHIKDEKKDFIDYCNDFINYYLKNKIFLFSYEELEKRKKEDLISSNGGCNLYYTLVKGILTNQIYNAFSQFIECLINYRMDKLGGIEKINLMRYYGKLYNIFLTTSNFKLPFEEFENMQDSTDLLMAIDILLENDVPIIIEDKQKGNLLNLPKIYTRYPVFEIKPTIEYMSRYNWLKQWFIVVFGDFQGGFK